MSFVCLLLTLYVVAIFGAIIISWFPIEPGSPLASVHRVLWQLTNPVLAPIRSVIPALRLGAFAIDLSPFIVIIAINIIRAIIGC